MKKKKKDDMLDNLIFIPINFPADKYNCQQSGPDR